MLRTYLTILFVCGVWADEPSQAKPARWCTITMAEQSKCLSMFRVFNTSGIIPKISCIAESSVEECLITIRENNADLIALDGDDVYIAGKVFGMKPIVKEIYTGGSTGYHGIAVTKANMDVTLPHLRGARTCHTAVGRRAGWNIPIGYLLESGQMESLGCKEHVKSAANFFSSSCAPGAEMASNNPYNDDVSNLCDICDGDCTRNYHDEPYSGYSGALRCLLEGQGQVAFIKPATLEANLGEDAPDWAVGVKTDDLRLLCKDGTTAPVSDAENCHIALGVSHSVMTSRTASDEDIASYKAMLLQAANLFSEDDNVEFTMFDSTRWNGRNLIFKDYTETMAVVEEDNYVDYLGDYGKSFEGLHKCPDNTIRFCTVSEQEQQKCRAMRDAFLEAELTPELSCFPATSHANCIDSIAAGLADVVTLDGGDIYRAGKDNGLIPILGEVYSDDDEPISYWAVAVVKADASFKLDQLAGKRSCHTGIMKTSGWIMPVGFLAENGYINTTLGPEGCDVTAAVGNFFSSSCAPGAKTRDYDVYGTNPDSLCENCAGKDDDNCARNSHEPYYGYSGAFRCLVEGRGDVAFVKHSTARENTGPRAQDEWNQNLRLGNFRLLCKDNTTDLPWKYRKCNLGKVPSHAVMTSGGKQESEIEEIVNLLDQGAKLFGHSGSGFKIFDSTGFTKNGETIRYIDNDGETGKHLLFKDSTISLYKITRRRTYDTWLGSSYVTALETIKCERN